MKKRWLAAALCAVFLTACAQQHPEENIVVSVAPNFTPLGETLREGETVQTEFSQNMVSIPDEESFSVASMDWALQLFDQLRQEGQNLLISPLSISQTLGLAANGMKGDTQKQLTDFLGQGITLSALNQKYTSQKNRLENYPQTDVRIANSIWYDNTISPKEEFSTIAADQYHAQLQAADFTDPSTAEYINHWVEEHTEGKIQNLFSSLSEETKLCLVNAVYFNGTWEDEIPGYAVREGEFYCTDGSIRSVDYMHSEEIYLHNDRASGILKPYKDSDLAFMAILPEDSMEEYWSGLTGEELLELLASAGEETADMALPVFEIKMEESIKLNSVLESLGITNMFDPSCADLSAMAGEPGDLYVSQVVHKTFLRVDSKGTEAAAATGMAVEAGATMVPQERKEVIFDRPFLFAVMDLQTQTALFLGVCETP